MTEVHSREGALATQGRRAAKDSDGVDRGGRWARVSAAALETEAGGAMTMRRPRHGHDVAHVTGTCQVQVQ